MKLPLALPSSTVLKISWRPLSTKRRMPCSLKRGSMPGVAVTDITIGRNFSRLAANSALSVNSTTDDTDGAGRAGQMQECLRSTIRC